MADTPNNPAVPTTLLTKLNTISREVEFIHDDKRVDFAKYTYASEEAIKKAIAPHFREQGVLLQLSVLSQEITEKGLTLVTCEYAFIDTDTGEKLTGTFCGQGQDTADKGIWKAIIGVIKYILTTTLMIPTGDDPENSQISPTKNYLEAKRPGATPLVRPDLSMDQEVSDTSAGSEVPVLEQRRSGPGAKNPNKDYWYDPANKKFHSWVEKNPTGDPFFSEPR